MSEEYSNKEGALYRIWRVLKRQVVQDVPDDSALCEFDCRKGQCRQEEWANCERRIRKAAGELFPDSRQ